MTGLYYYRARYYDAVIGRFVGRDPLGFDAGDANLYRLVGNDPAGGRDPSGLYDEQQYQQQQQQRGGDHGNPYSNYSQETQEYMKWLEQMGVMERMTEEQKRKWADEMEQLVNNDRIKALAEESLRLQKAANKQYLEAQKIRIDPNYLREVGKMKDAERRMNQMQAEIERMQAEQAVDPQTEALDYRFTVEEAAQQQREEEKRRKQMLEERKKQLDQLYDQLLQQSQSRQNPSR